MKEQIEEMVDDLMACHTEFFVNAELYTDYPDMAENMIAKGWRKQSEGEWKTETENWVYSIARKYCSNCGKAPHYDKHMRRYLLTDFCPNCGAKMKGGAE